ncbi:helicase domain protein [Cereibacter sphaeroides WS8N]|uniref:DEAD/DEAH box helicase n=1 Tax=Cereibacter sphaeroides TaxID=1063 RepID=UPI00020B0125|nr:DEAD/DEAH box helicase [Cereibacter sphaeroides]EGJ20329.1 helicase domain protein [Cereibacter sphaeroides WS8N]
MDILRASERSAADWADIFRRVTALSNESDTHDEARELVIRTLDKRHEMPSIYDELLDNLVKSVGLIPYLSEVRDFADAMLVGSHEIPGLEGRRFHSLQLNVYKQIMAGRSVVLSATTSVGKSMVVDAVVASGKFKRIVIIVPTIALIDETRKRLASQFGEKYEIITHASQLALPDAKAIFILTQERALLRADLQNVDFFVVDEFYKLDIRSDLAGGTDRSVDLNLAFHKLASSGAQFYLIGPHVDGVRGISGKYQHTFIPSKFSTVALDVEYYDLPKDGKDRVNKVRELVTLNTGPTLIYCQSPAKCAEVAQFLIDEGAAHETNATLDATSWLEQEFPSGWIVTEALKRGIGIHHGNVPRAIQQYMIRAFSEKKLSIIICTSTLIEGINTIAENVIVYDRRVSTSNIDYFSYRNVAGRAGRMGEWFIGKVFVLERPPEVCDMVVDIAVDAQPGDTPISLLLGLSEDDLTALSKERIEAGKSGTELELATIRENRHIDLEIQDRIAKRIRNDMFYRNLLNWSHLPKQEELACACEVIFREMDMAAKLSGFQIYDGNQLAAVLTKLRTSSSLREFLEDRVRNRRAEHSVSDAIDNGLRFLRSYVCFTFPRQLSAIERIHRDVCSRLPARSKADYRYFVSQAETMFLGSNVFFLDEFGIPFSLGQKLLQDRFPEEPFQDAIDAIAAANLGTANLHPFEVDILNSIAESLPRSVHRV